MNIKLLAVVPVGLLALAGCGASTTSEPAATVTVTQQAPADGGAAAPAEPVEPVTTGDIVTEGTWTVGEDMKAGTYKTVEAVSGNCYWAITKTGTNGADIISNGLPTGGFPSVTVKKGQDFENQGCGDWKKK